MKLVAIATIALLLSGVADAATLIVNTTADPGSGTCSSSACTLRDAINAAAPNDTITFAIPASDPGCSAQNLCTIQLDGPTGPLFVNNALTIDGSGQQITISQSNPTPIQLLVNEGPGLSINALTFANGSCFDNSPGGPNCFSGGAILNGGNGTLTVTNSTFSGNSGGESCFVDGTHHGCDPLSGGAIANLGTATVRASTFIGNEVDMFADGAAVASFSGTLTVINSTFYGNTGNTTVFNGNSLINAGFSQPSSLTLINSTLTAGSGSGVANQGSQTAGQAAGVGTLTLSNDIIAQNAGGSCFTGSILIAPPAAIGDSGGNVADDASCGFSQPSSLSNTNPNFAPLGNYGGLTQTMPLLGGSPAADSGLPASCPATDQRGVSRPGSGQTCSSGAFQALRLICPAPNGQAGTAYNSALNGSGGFPPYAYSITSGALPAGLTLDPATGQISGVPVSAGTFNFNVDMSDATPLPSGGHLSAICLIVVSPPAAKLQASPSRVSFGTVPIFSVTNRTIAVRNIGGSPAAMQGIFVVPAPGTPPNEFAAANSCPAMLLPGKTCTVTVLLMPLALGLQSANLLINSNGVGSPQVVPLSAIVIF